MTLDRPPQATTVLDGTHLTGLMSADRAVGAVSGLTLLGPGDGI